jgi:hypothetical protein
VAGLFYPSDPDELARHVASYLEGALPPPPGDPKAVIAPHAGYAYSGPVAGSAFGALRTAPVRRVVLIGPAHRVPLEGLAIPDVGKLETPLGGVELDRELVETVAGLPQVVVDDAPHRDEHSLEVELPFLQRLFPALTVLPLVVGDAAPEAVAEVLERAWGGAETAIVVSSDLSHYHDYATARRRDRATADAILSLAAPLDAHSACGAAAINGLLVAARRHRLVAREIDLRNSGDTAGDRRRVVGYGAFAFFDSARGEALLGIVRRTLSERLEPATPATPAEAPPAELAVPGACFVTLRHEGRLRGCIGSVEPYRSLAEDVAANARAAAFGDRRFPELLAEELAGLSLEVSELSSLARLAAADEAELLAALRPGTDGVLVEAGNHRALFLPQVWESLPDPPSFAARLREKAGLAADAWPSGIRWWRFTVSSWEGPFLESV